jgi:thioredoxin reductase (NADPH)
MSFNDNMLDCLVIGGGPAGLMAAVYLGRYRRSAVVIDDGGSRLTMIPVARNVLGFPDGIAGPELLERMRLHAARFGTSLELGRVEKLARRADGGFDAVAGSRRLSARKVLLCTGARDVQPDIQGLGPALRSGQVRYCPVCDGFETQAKRVAVLGPDVRGWRESAFLAAFGNQVTWLSMGSQQAVAERDLARLRQLGVLIADCQPLHVRCRPGLGVQVEMTDGQQLAYDMLYPALGLVHASQLATALGARTRADGQLEVDAYYETTVGGLYAAGDVAVDLNQINVAAGQAAIAATAIHNGL